MNILRVLLVISIAGGCYVYWNEQRHRAPAAVAEAGANPSTGFETYPAVPGQKFRTVYVIAAENCPHEDAQRADRLADELSRQGVRVERAHSINFIFASQPDAGVLGRINTLMNGPLPIVFVDGRAKSNPSLSDVVAEYNAGRQ